MEEGSEDIVDLSNLSGCYSSAKVFEWGRIKRPYLIIFILNLIPRVPPHNQESLV